MSISPDRILFEDEHLLAVTKLQGELTVGGSSLRRAHFAKATRAKGYGRQEGESGKLPLYDFLHKDHPGLRVLHRLDFDTSGVILFAKTKAAAKAALASHFKGWRKAYRAIVSGVVDRDRGVIRAELPSRNAKSNMHTEEMIPAVTNFVVLERFRGATYLECDIETGRHHQIRRHFAAIGHPLALDEIYGDPQFNKVFGRATGFRKFFLHAYSLDLPHPVIGENLHMEAPLPKAFEAVLEKLHQLH